jgi:hypothetical protein
MSTIRGTPQTKLSMEFRTALTDDHIFLPSSWQTPEGGGEKGKKKREMVLV